jgi:DNA-binding NarL/FixJ family response regulator
MRLEPRPRTRGFNPVTSEARARSEATLKGGDKRGDKLRILVADDHDVVRRGLRVLLEGQPGWEVCGEASTGREALDLVRRLKPDVVVLDVNLPELSGLDVAREVVRSLPQTEVLILTMDESPQMMRDLLRAGVRGYVFKSDVGGDLLQAVEALGRHQHFFTSRVAEMMYQDYVKSPPAVGAGESLTARQHEVIRLLALGKTNKEVASALGISVKTAEAHRKNIMSRLKLKAFSELVRYAVREGIIEE